MAIHGLMFPLNRSISVKHILVVSVVYPNDLKMTVRPMDSEVRFEASHCLLMVYHIYAEMSKIILYLVLYLLLNAHLFDLLI